jgi:hypothetical protein
MVPSGLVFDERKTLMMKFIALAVAVAFVCTPAAAASGKKKKMRVYQQGTYWQQPDWRNSRNDVYTDSGEYIGSDPDPFIRQKLRDEVRFFRRRN